VSTAILILMLRGMGYQTLAVHYDAAVYVVLLHLSDHSKSIYVKVSAQ